MIRARPAMARGAIVDDFDMDGMVDPLVLNRRGPASLFQNAEDHSGTPLLQGGSSDSEPFRVFNTTCLGNPETG